MADTTNRLAGTAYFAVNGISLLLTEASYDVGTVDRESAVGMDGPHGYIEKPKVPSISISFRDSGGLTVAELNAFSNETVTLELANGKIIIGSNMWSTGDQEVNAQDGTGKLKMEGLSVVEA